MVGSGTAPTNAFVGAAGSGTASKNAFVGVAGSGTTPTNNPDYKSEGAWVLSAVGRSLFLRRH